MRDAKEYLDSIPTPEEIKRRLAESVDETAALRKLLRISEAKRRGSSSSKRAREVAHAS